MNHLTNLMNLTDERREFHPEPTVAHHTALVALRALLVTGNRDVVLAALVHDSFKPAQNHAELAAEWLLTDEGRFWVWQRQGNLSHVHGLVLDHMNLKFGMPRRARFVPFAHIFPVLDDMVGRHELPTDERVSRVPSTTGTWILNDSLFFCGLSPIDLIRNDGHFTVSFNHQRFAHQVRWDELPLFFREHPTMHDLEQDLRELLHLN